MSCCEACTYRERTAGFQGCAAFIYDDTPGYKQCILMSEKGGRLLMVNSPYAKMAWVKIGV